jgi:hypothetical protein
MRFYEYNFLTHFSLGKIAIIALIEMTYKTLILCTKLLEVLDVPQKKHLGSE